MSLREKLDQGKFVVCGELGPPQSSSAKAIVKKAVHFKGLAGFDCLGDQLQHALPVLGRKKGRILFNRGRPFPGIKLDKVQGLP